jgi:hypothetical protein
MPTAVSCTRFSVLSWLIEPCQSGVLYETDMHCMVVWTKFKKLRYVIYSNICTYEHDEQRKGQ